MINGRIRRDTSQNAPKSWELTAAAKPCNLNVRIRRKSGEPALITGAEQHVRYPAVTRSAYTDDNASQAPVTGDYPESRWLKCLPDDQLEIRMKILGYVYRVVSNFAFLAVVYYSLNFMEKYNQRAVVAILVLVYATMRAVSALRSFYFFQKIERLELEARRLAAVAGEAGAAAQRRQVVSDVAILRRDGEMKSYIDLFFLAVVVLLCIAKIVTN
jgi:hypothetical protein